MRIFGVSLTFLYQEEINQDSFGNPALRSSTNYNVDFRWELFPTSEEILSIGVFGKLIEDPINRFLVNSAANDLSWANTGKQATAYGLEIEFRKNLLANEVNLDEDTQITKLTLGGNISYLETNQDLDSDKVFEETGIAAIFTNTESPLEGASKLILNSDLSFYREFKKDNSFRATAVVNYFSDRIYALGFRGRGHLVDKGFVTLDFISKYQFNKNFGLSLQARNLLNPLVKRVNENAEGKLDQDNPGIPSFLEDGPVTALSYKMGVDVSLGLTYKF